MSGQSINLVKKRSMRAGAFKVGVIGCGEISKRYFLHCPIFDILEVVAFSSLHMDSARDMAKKYGVPKASISRCVHRQAFSLFFPFEFIQPRDFTKEY